MLKVSSVMEGNVDQSGVARFFEGVFRWNERANKKDDSTEWLIES